MRALPRQKRARNQLVKIVCRLKVVRDILLSLLLLSLSPVSESLIIYANFLHGVRLEKPFQTITAGGPPIGEAGIEEPARLSLAGLGDGRRWARLARACG